MNIFIHIWYIIEIPFQRNGFNFTIVLVHVINYRSDWSAIFAFLLKPFPEAHFNLMSLHCLPRRKTNIYPAYKKGKVPRYEPCVC